MSMILVDRGSLRRGNTGAVVGSLSFRFESSAFPHETWTDFVVVVLGWWLERLAAIVEGTSRSVDLEFMDGPFALRLRREKSGRLVYEAVELCAGGEVVEDRGTLDGPALLADTYAAAAEIVAECRSRSWSDDDVRELERRVDRAAVSLRPVS